MQPPRPLSALGPRPFTAPPTHRNSQPPPFFPSPSGLLRVLILRKWGRQGGKSLCSGAWPPPRTPGTRGAAVAFQDARTEPWPRPRPRGEAGSAYCTSAQTGTVPSPPRPHHPPRLLSRSRKTALVDPRSLSGYGVETLRTGPALAHTMSREALGGPWPQLSVPRSSVPPLCADRAADITFPLFFQAPIRYRWLARVSRRPELRSQ